MRRYTIVSIIKGLILFAVILILLLCLNNLVKGPYIGNSSVDDGVSLKSNVDEDVEESDEAVVEPRELDKIVLDNLPEQDVADAVLAEPTPEITEAPEQEYLEETFQPYISLSDSEMWDFASLVYLESGGESYECQKAVASVVLNRMVVSGLSFYDVIYSPGQFEPADQIPYTYPSDSCIMAVHEVTNYGPTLPLYVTYFRSSYYFDWVEPYTNMDNTYFSYSEELRVALEGL